MFDWDDLKVFLAAYREGSIGRAAEALGMSGSTVSRRLSALEDAVGVALFVRSPDGLLPTEAGRKAHAAAEDAERSATRIETVLGADDVPRGSVRVATTSELLRAVILPSLFDFAPRHPELTVEFVEASDLADLERWEADLAIRPVRPTSGDNLVVTKLRDTVPGLFCARRLIESRGLDPDDPVALQKEAAAGWPDWPWVGWTSNRAHLGLAQLQEHRFADARVVLRASNMETLRLAAAAGIGLVLLPSYFGRVSPTLVRLPAQLPGPQSVYLVGHRATRHSARVDVVWTHLVDLLRGADQRDLVRGRGLIEAAYGVKFPDGV